MSRGALILTLVAAVSPIALTVCQVTCSVHTTEHHSAAAGAGCHESAPDPGGVTLKSGSRCQHSVAGVLLVKALPTFELPAASLDAIEVFAVDRTADLVGSHRPPISPPASPPPLLPLRI